MCSCYQGLSIFMTQPIIMMWGSILRQTGMALCCSVLNLFTNCSRWACSCFITSTNLPAFCRISVPYHILCHEWFSLQRMVQLSSENLAARELLCLSKVINQAVGDAISGILLVEAALRRRQWGMMDWAALYTDLPSRQSKVINCIGHLQHRHVLLC